MKLNNLVELHQGRIDQWSRHGRALDPTSASFLHVGPAELLTTIGEIQQNASGTESTLEENRTPSCTSEDFHRAETVSDSRLMRISRSRAPHYRRNRCPSWCSCVCHKTCWLQTPESLYQALGLLFVGVSGFPIQYIKCNERLCRRQSIPTLKVNYFFPQWIVSRVLQFALRLSYMQGPELILRMPLVVPDNAPLMFFAVQGNLAEIQSLFNQGLASPFDVAMSNGRTALHV